jgi:hypothetical protein
MGQRAWGDRNIKDETGYWQLAAGKKCIVPGIPLLPEASSQKLVAGYWQEPQPDNPTTRNPHPVSRNMTGRWGGKRQLIR